MGLWGSRRQASLVAASGATVLCVWLFLGAGSGVRFATSVTLVDVSTGDLFEFVLDGRAVSIPARNPDTGARSLLPVERRSGLWVLAPRELAGLTSLAVRPEAVADLSSGEVRVAGPARRVPAW